jgi:hypothetical protein
VNRAIEKIGRFDTGLLFFWALLIAGFGYVAMVLCGRATPFASGDTSWNDWMGVALSGPALYLFGTRHTLVSPRNMVGFCLPFFAGLHWEYVGRITGANFSLTGEQLAHLNRPSQIALICGILVTVAIGALCLYEARKARILGRYVTAIVCLPLAITAISIILGPDYTIHIHHYFWALCLLPFVRFGHPACAVTQGMLAGIYVEGAARYGLSPVWVFHSG